MSRSRPLSPPDPSLVFIGGFPSGGTDLLKNVLNAHPDVLIAGEFPLLSTLARRYGPSVAPSDAPEALEALRDVDSYGHLRAKPEALLAPVDGRYAMAQLYRHLLPGGDVRWLGSKTPSNTENLGPLRALFPGARFILIVRDPRDVALSWGRKWGKDRLLCAAKWNERMLRGREVASGFPEGDVAIVRYEDLLADLESHTRRLCHFLDLPHAPEMLRFDEHVHKRVDGKVNYGRQIVSSNSGGWRSGLSPRAARRIEEVAFDGLIRYGYEVTRAQGPRPLRRWERLRGVIRDAWATVGVGNRASEDQRLRARVHTARFEVEKLLRRRSV